MDYHFYGWEGADVAPADKRYKKIENPRRLYDLLSEIWCEYTCAPRLRAGWSPENKTLGQCSITAFLAQDIFGGKVYGILRPGGNYHCYNAVDGCVFDLTSEQFGGEKLDYTDNPEQSREIHFAKTEKFERYQYLKAELEKRLAVESAASSGDWMKDCGSSMDLARFVQKLERVKNGEKIEWSCPFCGGRVGLIGRTGDSTVIGCDSCDMRICLDIG